MKANELRIGNLVKATVINDGKILSVNEIINDNGRYILYFNQKAGDFLKDCEPIPLTEEWLLKFGFNQCFNEYHMLFSDNIFSLDIVIENDVYYPVICSMPKNIFLSEQRIRLHSIQYVHQLQNLYFALTGEELTLK